MPRMKGWILRMERTITIKGIGRATAKVDTVVILMKLNTVEREYDAAMDKASDEIETLRAVLYAVGFKKDRLKTTDFNVDTEYESKRDSDGNYTSRFVGYCVSHSLKLTFDFDTDLLNRTLCTISRCAAHPKISVSFTVGDATAIKDELLRSAAQNAREKAEVLASASGVTLGEIVNIIYDWAEINVFSQTRFMGCDYDEMPCTAAKPMDIEPEDIDVKDSVTFVWSII